MWLTRGMLWGSHGLVACGDTCTAVQYCGWTDLQVLWRSLLPPSSGGKGEAAACTKVSVPVHHAVGFTSLMTETVNTFWNARHVTEHIGLTANSFPFIREMHSLNLGQIQGVPQSSMTACFHMLSDSLSCSHLMSYSLVLHHHTDADSTLFCFCKRL